MDRSTVISEEMMNFALRTGDLDDSLCLAIARRTLDKLNLVVFLLITCSVHLKCKKIHFLLLLSKPFSNKLNDDKECSAFLSCLSVLLTNRAVASISIFSKFFSSSLCFNHPRNDLDLDLHCLTFRSYR